MSFAPPSTKRREWPWCRLDKDFADWPIWRVVAKKANTRVHAVLAFAVRLELLANRSEPRGSVAEFSVDEFAASLQLSTYVVARIRATLEEPDIAWIDQDHIVSFHQRNPDRHDPTAAERQRRRRAKLKGTSERRLIAELGTGPPGYPQSRYVTRDTVTVTPDQIREVNSGASVENTEPAARGNAAGPPNAAAGEAVPAIGAEEWLLTTGLKIAVERLQVNRNLAETRLERWRRDCENDEALRQAIAGADKADYVGARFHNLIVDQIKRQKLLQAQGPRLPLGPASAIGKRSA